MILCVAVGKKLFINVGTNLRFTMNYFERNFNQNITILNLSHITLLGKDVKKDTLLHKRSKSF